jgi:polysaccharide biosynthesis protein PslH
MTKILVYKPSLIWPRRIGHDVHTYEMMRKWIRLGAQVHLATARPASEKALDGLDLESVTVLSDRKSSPGNHHGAVRKLAKKYTSYWGIPETYVDGMASLAQDLRADAVIVSGLDALPLLSRVNNTLRIWYAADEWLWHHLSLIQWRDRSTWSEVKMALVKGLYERVFRPYVDRVWVVSEVDRRAIRAVMGVKAVDIFPNGVDADYFTPQVSPDEKENSLVFWGRLDFEPNVQGLQWFCQRVWPLLVANHPSASFTIMGASPIQAALELGLQPGIRVLADVDDLRPEIARNQVVVLPFISGAGVKNKLLEAAAMSKAIVSSPKAAAGLLGTPPINVASSPSEWQQAIEHLWSHSSQRHQIGDAARTWVCSHHVWETTARAALDSITGALMKGNPASRN